MIIRSIFAFTLILNILSACASTAEITQNSPPTFTPTFTPSSTTTPEPSIILPQNTPTLTSDPEYVMMTAKPQEIVITALNLQLDSSSLKLTEAANQIATMAAESSSLETQLAVVSTNAENNSSNQNSTSGGFTIPSNVHTVVTVQKATIFIPKSYNKAGAPIMLPYEPRVYLPAGTEAWVYKKSVKADGGAIYYESYDPDGQTATKVYFKASHIQIRLPSGSPDPDKFPANVAKAEIIDKTVLFVATSYDKAGKPIMVTYKPYIRYNPGNFEIVYPKYVIATGGSHWHPVYDPDGNPSGYIRSTFISFPGTWD
jgi:hypothetical protein